MIRAISISFTIAISGAPVFAQDSDSLDVPGSDKEVVAFCDLFPELCELEQPVFSSSDSNDDTTSTIVSPDGTWKLDDDSIKVPVPICRIDPRLCIGDPTSKEFLGVGIIEDESAGALDGLIVIDPKMMFIREGLIVIPLSEVPFEGVD